MQPLGRVVIGLVLVLVDLRVNGLDLVPDVLGWVIVLTGLGALTARDRWFQVATAGAVLALVASLFAFLDPPSSLVELLDTVGLTAVVFGVCSGVMATQPPAEVRATADRIRWVLLGFFLLTTVVTLPLDGATDVGGGLTAAVVLLVLVGLGLVVWFMVFSWRQRELPGLRG